MSLPRYFEESSSCITSQKSFDAIMMPLSISLADRCDAVLRIGGASAGADAEVERIRARGGAVYLALDDIEDPATVFRVEPPP
jgi:hypothetical protein